MDITNEFVLENYRNKEYFELSADSSFELYKDSGFQTMYFCFKNERFYIIRFEKHSPPYCYPESWNYIASYWPIYVNPKYKDYVK